MYAVQHFLTGLAIAHLVWLFCFLCGTLVRKPKAGESRPMALLSVVIASGSGVALTGLATFFLGLAYLIRWEGFVLFCALLAAAFVVRGDSPFRLAFWTARIDMVRSAASLPAIAVYLVMIVDAIPSTLPDRAFDSLFAYSVSAVEYATTHYLVIDRWLRDPFWTNNWVLVETWMYVFRIGEYLPFQTWLMGMLTVLGIFGTVTLEAERLERRSIVAETIALCIAAGSVLALLLNPMFLWLNSGSMLDVPFGFLFLHSSIAAYLSIRLRDRTFVAPMILSGALLIGAKESFLVFLPLYFVMAWAALRFAGSSRRAIVVALVALTCLSAPWYAKNFIQDGDPVPPLLNLALRGHDFKYSASDNERQLRSLRRNRRDAVGLLRLPIDLFLNDDELLVSLGQTAICLLLALPAIVVIVGLIRPTPRLDIMVLASLLLYAISYWILTSYHARYALLFYPALCAFVGIILMRVARRQPASAPVMAAASLLLAFPTPSSFSWLTYFKNADFVNVINYDGRDAYLIPRIEGYREEEYLSAELTRLGRTGHQVYGVGTEMLKYPFILHGIHETGDVFGPEGYENLGVAVAAGSAAAYLAGLDVDAVIFPADDTFLSPLERRRFEEQLKADHYSALSCSGKLAAAAEIFIKDDATPPPCTL
jgi:hypothetical protein